MDYKMDYIRETYDLPFLRKGIHVIFQGKTGVVTGTHAAHLKVKLENGDKICLHPTWNIAYCIDGEIVKDFRN